MINLGKGSEHNYSDAYDYTNSYDYPGGWYSEGKAACCKKYRGSTEDEWNGKNARWKSENCRWDDTNFYEFILN